MHSSSSGVLLCDYTVDLVGWLLEWHISVSKYVSTRVITFASSCWFTVLTSSGVPCTCWWRLSTAPRLTMSAASSPTMTSSPLSTLHTPDTQSLWVRYTLKTQSLWVCYTLQTHSHFEYATHTTHSTLHSPDTQSLWVRYTLQTHSHFEYTTLTRHSTLPSLDTQSRQGYHH